VVTKTEQALILVDSGKTVRQAAREVDISESALHSAIKKRRAQITCPCCDSRVEKLLVPEPMVEALWEMRGKR
jgi:hypothetical protein